MSRSSMLPPLPRRIRPWRTAIIAVAAVVVPGLAAASLTVAPAQPALSRLVMTDSASIMVSAHSLARPEKACPSNMAHVGASCVDKFEGTLVEIGEDGSETAFSPYEAPNGKRVRAVSRPNVVPQAHISMVEAKRACEASNKRLCRANEWKTACKGPEKTAFPYGAQRVAGACTDTNRASPMHVLYGGERSGRTMNDPRANQQDNTLATTGEAEQCTNGFGVHDMVGNIHEWTDDGSFRGGYYLDTSMNGEGCEYRTTRHAPDYYDYSTGFRCCADENTLGDDAI